MTLKLYFHPLSSFCQKVLAALYENATPFEPVLVDLMDATSNAEFRKVWPIGKFPVLRDEARGRTVPESSIIIEYLDRHFPGPSRLVPENPDRANETRLHDRFFDLYLNVPMQKVVTDRLRPEGQRDGYGVEEARGLIGRALDILERDLAHGKPWVMGDAFGMADCAAAPALFYVDKVTPLAKAHPRSAAYLERLTERPSFARALKEAEPWFKLFPAS
ncbi:MAG: glutathione S-transferase family protein [Parvibaculaceae bacterium]